MPLEPPDHQYWRAAVGYVELGMFQEPNDQLENIDPFNRAAPEVLAVRIAVYQRLKKWALMREVAKCLAEFQSNDVRRVTMGIELLFRASWLVHKHLLGQAL